MQAIRCRRALTFGIAASLTVSGLASISVESALAVEKPKKQAPAATADPNRRVMPLPEGKFSVGTAFGTPGPMWASGFHTGLDLPAATGTPVLAAAAGTVSFTGNGGAYGNLTRISLGGGIENWYAHQSAITAKVGDVVTPGQQIGFVGSTGNTTGPHLHFEVRVNGATADPKPWLSGAPAVAAQGIGGATFDPVAADELRGKLAEAESELGAAQSKTAEAKKKADAISAKLAASQRETDAAKAVLAAYARSVYMTGIDPEWLAKTDAMTNPGSINEFTDRQVLLDYANSSQNQRVSDALNALAAVKGARDEAAAVEAKAKEEEAKSQLKLDDLNSRLDATMGMWQVGGSFDGTVPAGGSKSAMKTVQFALSQLGAPYNRNGGTGPTYGCNGFVWRAWKEGGSSWPLQMANSQALNHQWVVPVSPGQEQPGDIIFWRMNNGTDLPGRIDHVGLIVDPGKGVFIHASSPRTGVELNNYKNTTFYKYPAMIGRMLTAPSDKELSKLEKKADEAKKKAEAAKKAAKNAKKDS